MTYTTDTSAAAPTQSDAPSTEAPSHEETHAPSTGRRWLGWAGVVASLAAAATLAVVVFVGSDADTKPVLGAHSGLIEHGSIRSIEGSVEDTSPVLGAHSGVVERGSVRSIEGTVEDATPLSSAQRLGQAQVHQYVDSLENRAEEAVR
jgi:hypothetical protein